MTSITRDNDEFSGSDADDGFADDMEALRRACIVTGANFEDLKTSSATTVPRGATTSDSDEEDDLELVRKIQRRFSSSIGVEEPLFLKPLSSLPPAVSGDEEDDDDLEVLRAIQRRFGQYENDTLKHSKDNYQQKPETCATKIALEKEHSSDLFGDTTNVLERFPDGVDSYNNTQNSKPSNNSVPQSSGLIEWHQNDARSLVTLPPRDSGFPKSAQVFIDAIKKNRSCQKFLRSKLIQIEARMEENRKLGERFKILKDFQVTCRKRTGRALSQKKDARVQLISVPKQKATSKVHEKKVLAMFYGPAENSHVANYRMALAQYPLSLNRKKWSKEENENLAKGIKQQYQEMLLQKSVDLFSGAEGYSGDSNVFDSIIASIRDLEITPENIRLFLPKVNWEQLASMYVSGRSAAECEARWLNCEDPLNNHHPWKKMEDKHLLHTVQQKGIDNWIDIAASLGTNRTPFQSLARYQRSLNASILRREWTEAEDNILRAAVATYGESNWQIVASTLVGRTGTQCSNRWLKSLHPDRERVGKWDPDEDKRLKVAVMLFGPTTWKKIAQFVPGRTHVQCRERWVNSLDPSLNLDVWTEDEDSRLKKAITEHGFCWSKVAPCVPRRTDSLCRRRWKVLFPKEVLILKAAKKVQKKAIQSNFVDRESERPDLTPDDFVPLPAINSDSESEHTNPTGKQKRKARNTSKIGMNRLTKEAQTCPVEAPELTVGAEVQNFGGNGAISNKKRSTKTRSKNKKCNNPTEDISATCPDPTLSAISNSEEVGPFHGVNATEKKKASSGSQKRKSGCRRPGLMKIDAASGDDPISKKRSVGKPCSEVNKASHLTKDQLPSCTVSEVCLVPIGDHTLSPENTELLMITNGEEVRQSDGDGAMKGKKASKLHPRKRKCTESPEELQGVTSLNEAETFGGNNSISNKKRRVNKPHAHSNKNNGIGPTEDQFLSCPDSTSGGDGAIKKRRFGGENAAKKKKTLEPFSRSESTVSLTANPSLLSLPEDFGNSDAIETSGGDDVTLAKEDRAPSQPPLRIECAVQSEKSRDYITSSIEVATLHSECHGPTYLLDGSHDISLPPECSSSYTISNGNSRISGVYHQDEWEKSRAEDKTYSNKILETEDGDDMTLAFFLRNKLKKRPKKRSGELTKSGSEGRSSMQNDESLTSCNGGIPNVLPSLQESVEGPVSINLEGINELGDSCSPPPGFESRHTMEDMR